MTDQDTDQIAPSPEVALSNAWRRYDRTPEGKAARLQAEEEYEKAKVANQIALDAAQLAYMDVRASQALDGEDKPTYEEIMAAVDAYTQARQQAAEDLDRAYEDTLGKYHHDRMVASWAAYREARQSQE